MSPFWLSAFLDLPADRHEAATAFWSSVTGYAVSAPRGDRGEFTTLVPPDGDDFLRIQRVEDGEAHVHLDLHVDDPDAAAQAAVSLGATVSADHGDYWTLSSPGGLVFCLVSHRATRRPAPGAAVVDQVCLDVPPGRYADELAFWADLTGWARRDPDPGSEFGRVTPPADLALKLLVQRLDDEQPVVTAHLDWAALDHEATLAAHEAAGAVVLGRHEGWTVLRDPAGLAYCVTRRTP